MRPTEFKGNLVVMNMPDDMTASDLAAMFDEHGLVLGAQIKRIPSNGGGTVGLGLVSLAPDTAADQAVKDLHGTVVGGSKLRVERAKVQPKGASASRPAAKPQPVARPAADPLGAPRYAQERLNYERPATERKVVVEYRTRPRFTQLRSVKPLV